MTFRPLLIVLTALLSTLPVAAEEIVHERIEWSDMWVTDAETDARPRVLLVGDSIVKGYYNGVEKALGDGAHLARYATSKFLSHPDFLAELGLLLKRYPFDVIHINNGLHGWGYTEEQYRAGLEALVDFIKKESPDSKVIWCLTTPVRNSKDLSKPDPESQPRVEARNAIAVEIMAKHEVPVTDLHTAVVEDAANFSQDGVHFSDAGRAIQAEKVAAAIRPYLTEEKQP